MQGLPASTAGRTVAASLLTAILGLFPLQVVFGADAGTNQLAKEQPPSPAQQSAQAQQPTPAGQSVSPISSGETLTLNRCIDIALRQNPSIVASQNTMEVYRSKIGEARSGYYPQLSAQASYDRVKPIAGTSAASSGTGEYDQYASSVSLSQNLLDFGKTSSSVDVSKYTYASSREDLSTAQDTVILSVKQAYYNVLQARRNRDVASDVIKQFQLHLDQAKGFYDVGTKAKIDVIKAEVDLSNAKLSLINSENALKIAWITLNNAMGVPDAPAYTIEDNLSFQKYPITLEEATARALENRPDLKSLIAKRQAAEANIDLSRTGYYPTLTGNASYNWAGETLSGMEQGWTAGVVLTVPLFSGFLTSHQVAEAKSSLYVARANEDSLRLQILLDVRQAFLNLEAAEASIATAELASRQAKENLDLANGRYSAGVGSPIEVSDAFATYVTAQASHTTALANYKIAQANIEKAMGER